MLSPTCNYASSPTLSARPASRETAIALAPWRVQRQQISIRLGTERTATRAADQALGSHAPHLRRQQVTPTLPEMSPTPPPFHLAFPTRSIDEARAFYGEILGCEEGRSAERWIDFSFFGHQLALHVRDSGMPEQGTTEVDGKQVPLPHFGVVLDMEAWHELAERLRTAGIQFVIEPHLRFERQVGEQATMFFRDPSGNAIEVKAFADPSGLFAR
jgi:extradiol dioxygenase family protein